MLLGLGFVLGCALQPQSATPAEATQARLERLAGIYSHFSLEVIIYNRELRLWIPLQERKSGTGRGRIQPPATNDLAAEQFRLLSELRALSGNDEKALKGLLKHANPKVRTLALGALFQREDGRDMPAIAALIEDRSPTFPDLHESMDSSGGPRPMSEVERVW